MNLGEVMSSISLLRNHVQSLRSNIPGEELDRLKREMLSLIEGVLNQQTTLSADDAHGKLSRREREVMSMMLEGQRLKQIAARLDISVKTVTTHRSRLMKKLRVEDNLGLYRYGVRNGLISV